MNAYQKAMLTAKVQHYNLNMFYPCGFEAEVECNWRIEQIINNFLQLYKNELETHTFILEYYDDTISMICYRMLKAISAISPINLIIYGKCKKTKKMIPKDQKKIGSFRLNRKLKKDNNIIFISPFNPLYKVAQHKVIFNKFNYPMWEPLSSFTPEQLKTLRIFYHIDYIKDDIIDDKLIAKNFQSWCENNLTGINKNAWLDIKLPFDDDKEINFYKSDKITVLKLTSSIEDNKILLREVENDDSILLYDVPPLDTREYKEVMEQLKQFALFLKNHSNNFGYYNILGQGADLNEYKEFFNCQIKYIDIDTIKKEA